MITCSFIRSEFSSLNSRLRSLQWRVLASAHVKQPYGRAGDYQRQHRAHRHEHGEPTCVGEHAVLGDRLANHALLGRGALDVPYVLVSVGVIVVVLVLGVVVVVAYVLGGVGVIVVVLLLAPVVLVLTVVVVLVLAVIVIVLVLAFVLVGVTVIVVVLVLAVVVVVAFVLAKDADLLLIPTAARRSGGISPGGRASNLSSSRGCRARSSLAGPEGVSVSQVGRLRGEINHNCLGAVVADGDVLLNRTVARRSGGITRGGGCGGTCSRRRGAVNYAVTYNMTSFSTDASGAYYGEGIVRTPGKHIVLRIYGYRYDQLVRVLSCGLGEGLP